MAALDDYGPFDSGVGANRTEDWWRDMFRHLTGSGVIDGVGSEFAVVQNDSGADQSVDVGTGECFIRGHWGEATSVKNVPLSAAHASQPRIDRIVLRADFTANTISVEVLEGTAAGSPTAPALTQSSSRWEISLAQIARAANDNVVGTADITDERTIITHPLVDMSSAPSDGDELVFNSTTGLWEPGSGVTPAMVQIAQSILGADAASIDFTSIPATYRDLLVTFSGRSSVASVTDDVFFRLNNDSGTNYTVQSLTATSTTVSAGRDAGVTFGYMTSCAGNSDTAGNVGGGFLLIPNYAATTFRKAATGHGGTATGTIRQFASLWANTAAVNRLTLLPGSGPNFKAGTVATLYGIGS